MAYVEKDQFISMGKDSRLASNERINLDEWQELVEERLLNGGTGGGFARKEFYIPQSSFTLVDGLYKAELIHNLNSEIKIYTIKNSTDEIVGTTKQVTNNKCEVYIIDLENITITLYY